MPIRVTSSWSGPSLARSRHGLVRITAAGDRRPVEEAANGAHEHVRWFLCQGQENFNLERVPLTGTSFYNRSRNIILPFPVVLVALLEERG